jgi:hypothetical protein
VNGSTVTPEKQNIKLPSEPQQEALLTNAVSNEKAQ